MFQKFIGAIVAIDGAFVDKTIIAGATYVGVNFAGAIIVVHLEQLSQSKCLFFRSKFSEQCLPDQMISIEIQTILNVHPSSPFLQDSANCVQCLFLYISPPGTVCTRKGKKTVIDEQNS